MSPKSKHNRRNIPQKKTEAASPVASANTQISQTSVPQSINIRSLKPNSASTNNAKTLVDINTASQYFITEIKWISLVATIIIILLVASYFIFR